MAGTASASAQVRPTNDVSRCTLITEPTAQRACIESSIQSRPAASFDPTVRPPRQAQARPLGRAAPRPRGAGAALNVDAGQGGATPQSAANRYRDANWRLQIP